MELPEDLGGSSQQIVTLLCRETLFISCSIWQYNILYI